MKDYRQEGRKHKQNARKLITSNLTVSKYDLNYIYIEEDVSVLIYINTKNLWSEINLSERL